MIYSLIDSHCDTVSKALDEHKNLFNNQLHIDLEKTKNLEQLTTYYKYKKVIVTLSIILLLILIVIM